MKRHKDIRETIHAWAYATAEEKGTNSGGTISYHGGELYSFNNLIAKRYSTKLGGEICAVNNASCSKTTTNHQRLAVCAFSGLKIVALWHQNYNLTNFSKESIIESYLKKLDEETQNLAEAKRASSQSQRIARIHSVANNLKNLVEFDILKKSELPAKLKKLLSIEIDKKAVEALKLEAARQLKKKLKANKVKILEAIDRFRNFQARHISSNAREYCGTDLIKFENGVIKTSQGVTIELGQALLLHKLVVSHRAKKIAKSYSNRMLLDGKYKVKKIDEKGNATVGCHFFKFEEIERCYKKEYLPTLTN